MRLSEAIRLGAMWRPQAFHVLFDLETGGSCALGAAAEAIGAGRFPYGYVTNKAEMIPAEWLPLKSITACPECSRDVGWQIDHVIIHLNNDHRWTRERIADWVASLEPQDSAPTVDAVSDTVESPVGVLRV